MTALAFINDLLSPGHLIVLLVIGLLFFGRRLPEVGRNVGRSIVEFKKGLRDISDDADREADRRRDDSRRSDDRRGSGQAPYVDDRPRAPLQGASPDERPIDSRPAASETVRSANDAR